MLFRYFLRFSGAESSMVAFVFASDTVNLPKLVLTVTVVSVINFISTKVRRMILSILRIQRFSAMANMLATFTSGPNAYIMSKFAVTVISITNFISAYFFSDI